MSSDVTGHIHATGGDLIFESYQVGWWGQPAAGLLLHPDGDRTGLLPRLQKR